VLGIAGRRRRFDELSLPRFAAWGAAGGLLLSAIPVTVLGMEAQSAAAAVIAGTLTLLALLLARMSEDRELLDASGDVAEVGLSEGEARELQGPILSVKPRRRGYPTETDS
jgi:hypothetical protein